MLWVVYTTEGHKHAAEVVKPIRGVMCALEQFV